MSDDDDVHRNMNNNQENAMNRFEKSRSRTQTGSDDRTIGPEKTGEELNLAKENAEFIDASLEHKNPIEKQHLHEDGALSPE